MLSRIEQKKTQAYYLSRTERNDSAQVLVKDRSVARTTLKKIKIIGLSTKLNAENKVKNILHLVNESETSTKDSDYIDRFEAQLTHAQNDGEHFDQLEASAIGLQRKVNPIVLHVDFDMSQISESLAKAIMYFKNKRGRYYGQSPR